jgi:hypothetical protein
MAHVQQQILDALEERLRQGDTVANQDVFVDRLDPLPKGKAAAILIHEGEGGDEIDVATINDVQDRTLNVEIACVLRATDKAPADAREFGLAVEKLLSPKAANTPLLALCKHWSITNSRQVQSGEGEDVVVSRVQSWRFTYFVRKAAPDVAI